MEIEQDRIMFMLVKVKISSIGFTGQYLYVKKKKKNKSSSFIGYGKKCSFHIQISLVFFCFVSESKYIMK